MSNLSERFDNTLALIAELADGLRYISGAIEESDVEELWDKIDAETIANLKFVKDWCGYTVESAVGNAIQKEMERAFSEGPATKASVIAELCKAVKGLGLEGEIISFGSMIDLN